MTRIILRALNAPVFILLMAIGVALQSSLFYSYPFLYLQPDILLLGVMWCALKRGFTEGGILTLVLANMGEVHSAAPQGLFMISYMVVYFAVRAAAKFFVVPNFSFIVLLTMGASIVWKLSYLLVLNLLNLSANQWKHTLVLLLPGAVMEGVVSVWVYRWLEKFDWLTFKNARAAQSLEEELQLETEN